MQVQVYDHLSQLLERLKPVKNFLVQNSYIKDTTNKLQRIMDDAHHKTTVLIIGKERVGKTTTINSFLGHEILASSMKNPTKVNTFIRYGEKEYINAVFLDGVEVTFDMKKLPLLTIADTESAQIIREHLDYIEIFLNDEMLQQVTLIDTTAIESNPHGDAYYSHRMLERADEVLWIIRAGSPMTDAELLLLQKYAQKGRKPYIVVNVIDHYIGDLQRFIESEKLRYGHLVHSFVTVSANKVLQAKMGNETQRLLNSNISDLDRLIESLINDQQKKLEKIVERFSDWLELFTLELVQIPMREPFMSAFDTVEQYNKEHQNNCTIEERDRVIITAYRDEYKKVSEVFEGVETLYQLLQKLAATFYLRDEQVEQFEELAFAYQQNVREYRKKHAEYTKTYGRVEAQYRKTFRKYLQQWSTRDTNEQVTLQVENLKIKFSELKDLTAIINFQQRSLLQNFYMAQNYLMELAQKRMHYILKQVSELKQKREVELMYLKSYNDKVKEFNCIELAQQFLQEAVKSYLMELPEISSALQQKLDVQFTKLMQITLPLTSVEDEKVFQEIPNMERVDFESEYPLTPLLSLTESDIISDIPPLPASI